MKCLITKEGQDIEERPCDSVYQSRWYEVDKKTEKETPRLGWFTNFDHIDQFETFLMDFDHVRVDIMPQWTDGERPIRLARILKT